MARAQGLKLQSIYSILGNDFFGGKMSPFCE
jgi:hypothetical protein